MVGPILKIVGAYEQKVAKNPLIQMGTPVYASEVKLLLKLVE